MSILIKGMKMPKKGDCKSLIIHSDGSISVNLNSTSYRAVEVPTPHGRIVDIDAVLDGINNADGDLTCGELIKQTTIIEAEE